MNHAKIHLIIIIKKTGKIQPNLWHIFFKRYIKFSLEILYTFIITYFTKMSITEILFDRVKNIGANKFNQIFN